MRKQLLSRKFLLLIAVMLMPAFILKAQLGNGWTEKFPKHYVHEEGGSTNTDKLVIDVDINNIYTNECENGTYATYCRTDGVEAFTLRKNPSGSRQRVEARVEDNYSSGIQQFDGEVWIKDSTGGTSGNSGPSAGVCVHQVWQWIMVVVFNIDNGDLRQHSTNKMITNAYERWVRVTTIHDYGKKRAQVWIDGIKRYDGTASGTDHGYNNGYFFHKYGIYNGAGSNPEVKWRNVRYFSGGGFPADLTPQKITIPERMTKKIGDADFSPATASSGLPCTYRSTNTSVATIVNGKVHIVGKGIAFIEAFQNGNSTYSAACKQYTKLEVTDGGGDDGTLEEPWDSISIGNPAIEGMASSLNSVFTVKGAGTDVWGTSDQFQFVYQPLDGDGEIVAKVNSITNTNTNAKAGVMIRQNFNASSSFAYITQRPDNQVQFDERTSAGAIAAHVSPLSGPTTGVKYLRLVRTGNNFSGYYSTAGATGPWTPLGSTSINMTNPVQIGLFVTSHNATALATAMFSDVAVITQIKQEQTITFNPIPAKLVNDADFAPGAVVSSNLPISYTSSNPAVATILNGNIHIVGAGTSTITASQAGNEQYNPAENKSQTLTVNKLDQTVTFNALPAKNTSDADFTPGATASSGLPVTYTSANTAVATIVNGNIHIVGVGTSVITATQAGNDTYKAASASQTLTVNPGPTNWYKIKVVNNPTYVLNGVSTTPVNGTNVNVYTSNTSNAQVWQMVDVGSGYVKIVPYTNTNFCLDCSTTPANGVNVQLWTYSGNTRQQWLVTDLGNGYKKITVRANAGYSLDCSTTPANNVNIQVWTYSGNNRQQWILEPILKSTGENTAPVPSDISVDCSPNPIYSLAKVNYTLHKAGFTNLDIYNAYGQKVKSLATGNKKPGNYTLTFEKGNLPEGLYFIKLTSGSSESIAKIIVK